jgi:hypothetical protein
VRAADKKDSSQNGRKNNARKSNSAPHMSGWTKDQKFY